MMLTYLDIDKAYKSIIVSAGSGWRPSQHGEEGYQEMMSKAFPSYRIIIVGIFVRG